MSTKPPFNIPPHTTPEGCIQQPMTTRQAKDILKVFPNGPSDDADCLEWTNYGAALYLARRDSEALDAVQHAVWLGRNATTLLNLGVVLEGYGRFHEALIAFKEANSLDPSGLIAGGAYADGLLRQGYWKEGWPLYSLYHSRLLVEHTPTLQDLAGKRVVIIKNGKYGDNIYHLRWFRELRAIGCNITYVCDKTLIPLLKNHPWIDRLIPAPQSEGVIQWYAEGLPTHDENGTLHFNLNEFDYILSIMALPAIVKASPLYAWPGPYIRAPRNFRWPNVFRHPRVGLCWKAGDGGFPRAHRSLNADQVARLRHSVTQLKWVDLVYGETASLNNWVDTARVVNSCDLIVTVDTGVAHLAGAMGKQVWVILSGASAWQYGLDDEYKLTYPTMHVFRNFGVGTDRALHSLIEALHEL